MSRKSGKNARRPAGTKKELLAKSGKRKNRQNMGLLLNGAEVLMTLDMEMLRY